MGIKEAFFKELIFESGMIRKDFQQNKDLAALRHREHLEDSGRHTESREHAEKEKLTRQVPKISHGYWNPRKCKANKFSLKRRCKFPTRLNLNFKPLIRYEKN